LAPSCACGRGSAARSPHPSRTRLTRRRRGSSRAAVRALSPPRSKQRAPPEKRRRQPPEREAGVAVEQGSARALRADRLAVLLLGQLAAVMHQEAAHAGELVGLAGQHADGELFAREVGTGQLEAFGRLGLVLVDDARALVGTPRL